MENEYLSKNFGNSGILGIIGILIIFSYSFIEISILDILSV